MEYNKIFRASRIAALQELFSSEFNTNEIEHADDELFKRTLASRSIVTGVQDHKKEIDTLINKYAKNWTVSRMNKIDVNILRLAIYELMFADEKIDKAIIIDEAIELAKDYGTDKSYKFINGLLDNFVKHELSDNK